MLVHPGEVARGNFHDPVVKFGERIYMSQDKKLKDKLRAKDANRTAGQIIVGGAIEWASWAELTDDDLDISMMPFFVDSLRSGSASLPKDLRLDGPGRVPFLPSHAILVDTCVVGSLQSLSR